MNRFVHSSAFVLFACFVAGCAADGDDDKIGSNAGDGEAGAGTGEATTDDGTPAERDDNNTEADEPGTAEDDGGLFGGAPTITVDEPVPTASQMPNEPAPNPDEPSADSPLVECESAVALGDDPRIDDFENRDDLTLAVDNRDGGWYDYDDGSNDGQLVEWVAGTGASEGSLGVMHVKGAGFGEYSGVGFGLRWTETGAEHCYYDASYYDGIQFAVRGDTTARIALQNPAVRPVDMGGTCALDAACYDSHGYDFAAGADWSLVRVSFESMKQAGWGTPAGPFDPSQLFTVEFQFPSGGAYELWLDDIAFYNDGDPVPPEPVPDAGSPTSDETTSDETTSDETSLEPTDAGAPTTDPVLDASVDYDAGLPAVQVDASIDASL